jgi:O-antigen/teichoic acid export membrane protein
LKSDIFLDRAGALSAAEHRKLPPARTDNFVEFLCVAGPKVLGGMCGLAINILLLRFFGPEQFGLYAVCMNGVLLSDAILGSAVDLGVLRMASAKRVHAPEFALAVQKAGLYLKAGAVVIVSVLLVISARVIQREIFHRPNTFHLIGLSCFAALGLMLLRSAQTNLQIEQRFILYGLLETLQTGVKYGSVAVLLFLWSAAPGGVLFFSALGPLLGFSLWLFLTGKRFREAAPVTVEHFRTLANIAKWFALTFGLGTLISRLDIIFVSTWSTIAEAGIFGAAQVFAFIPQLLGTYLAIVYGPRVMPYLQDGKFSGFFRQFQVRIFLVSLMVCAAAFPILNLFGRWLLPGRFVAAEGVILVLLPGALAGLATFPVTITFLMFVRPRFLFTMDCTVLPVVILLYAYAIPRYGAIGAAWVTSSSCVTRAVVAQFTAWRAVRYGTAYAEPLGVGALR